MLYPAESSSVRMDPRSYDCGISTYPLLGITVGEMLASVSARFPDTEAVVSVHQDIRWTYRDLLSQVNSLAKG